MEIIPFYFDNLAKVYVRSGVKNVGFTYLVRCADYCTRGRKSFVMEAQVRVVSLPLVTDCSDSLTY